MAKRKEITKGSFTDGLESRVPRSTEITDRLTGSGSLEVVNRPTQDARDEIEIQIDAWQEISNLKVQ
jgi:hypothetical protein